MSKQVAEMSRDCVGHRTLSCKILIMKLTIILLVLSNLAFGHGGGLDSSGGHNNRKTSEYHCHREPCFSLQNIKQQELPETVVPNASDDSTYRLTGDQTNKCNGHLLIGVPGKSDQILCRLGYAIGYDYSRKSAEWVAYVLSPQIPGWLGMMRKKSLSSSFPSRSVITMPTSIIS